MPCAGATASTIRAGTLHGALLDCELLAEVYLELIGGRQPGLGLDRDDEAASADAARPPARQRPSPLPPRLSEQALAAHAAFVETLGPDALWREFGVPPSDAND